MTALCASHVSCAILFVVGDAKSRNQQKAKSYLSLKADINDDIPLNYQHNSDLLDCAEAGESYNVKA